MQRELQCDLFRISDMSAQGFASRCLLESDLPRGTDLTTESAMESPQRFKGVDGEGDGDGAWAGVSLSVAMEE